MAEEVTNVEQQEPVQLQLNDIATMVQVIDLVSRRGGFEGPELEAVGGLRSRIVAFLNAASKNAEEQPEGQVPVVEEEVETDGDAG
jgi:hypothetical protein|tara:strand:- start:836 stop:1093 length:258 start_codon:yes stop_codon:yes gene_type:complete